MPSCPDPSLRTAQALRHQFLSQGEGPVEVVETHISRILLTPTAAYKLKKPVRLPFADFSTVAARKYFCEEELRLNRRLAPSIYLGVLPVRGSPDAPRLGTGHTAGEGDDAIDWVLHMRRFPTGSEFDALARRGALERSDMDRIALRLARFHASAPAAPPGQAWGMPQQVAQTITDVFETLAPLLDPARSARLQRLRASFDALRPTLAPRWSERRASGHVREGHGDLHLANIVRLGDDVTAFDCIEFSPALRWIDVMADIAFLTMDLHAHGLGDLAWRFLDTYLAETGDYAGLAVLRPYEAYRALVRAMAQGLRDQQGAAPVGAAARPDYLACAEALATPRQPRLLITYGLSGSGKSTVAAALLEVAGAVRLRSDVERKRLFGLHALADSNARGLDIYTPDASQRTFARLRALAGAVIDAGYPVIVDAAFLRQAERDAFHALAQERGVPFAILHCHAAAEQLRKRVAQRLAAGGDPSEADLGVLAHQHEVAEPLAPREQTQALNLPTDRPWNAQTLYERWMAN